MTALLFPAGRGHCESVHPRRRVVQLRDGKLPPPAGTAAAHFRHEEAASKSRQNRMLPDQNFTNAEQETGSTLVIFLCQVRVQLGAVIT